MCRFRKAFTAHTEPILSEVEWASLFGGIAHVESKAVRGRPALHSTSCEMDAKAFPVSRSLGSARASSRRFWSDQSIFRGSSEICLAIVGRKTARSRRFVRTQSEGLTSL